MTVGTRTDGCAGLPAPIRMRTAYSPMGSEHATGSPGGGGGGLCGGGLGGGGEGGGEGGLGGIPGGGEGEHPGSKGNAG